MLAKEVDGTRFRLIGIGVSTLSSPQLADPDDLIDVDAGRRAAAEVAMDSLRSKFGLQSIETGYTFRPRPAKPDEKS